MGRAGASAAGGRRTGRDDLRDAVRPRPSAPGRRALRAPPEDLPPALAGLDYDGYRAIVVPAGREPAPRADTSARSCSTAASCSASAWRCTSSRARAGPPDRLREPACSTSAGGSPARASRPDLGFAGFRLHYAFPDTPAWRPKGFQEEFLVFLGASYFRLRGGGPGIRALGPGARHRHRRAGGRGVSRLHRPLDLRAGARGPHA